MVSFLDVHDNMPIKGNVPRNFCYVFSLDFSSDNIVEISFQRQRNIRLDNVVNAFEILACVVVLDIVCNKLASSLFLYLLLRFVS